MDQNTGITGWLISHSGGSIKDGKQANIVLILFAVIIFAISIFLFSRSVHPGQSSSAKTGTQIPPQMTVTHGFKS